MPHSWQVQQQLSPSTCFFMRPTPHGALQIDGGGDGLPSWNWTAAAKKKKKGDLVTKFGKKRRVNSAFSLDHFLPPFLPPFLSLMSPSLPRLRNLALLQSERGWIADRGLGLSGQPTDG